MKNILSFLILILCALAGAATDFLFNGVLLRGVFHAEFKEAWMYIYVPVDFAVAMILSTGLSHSRWQSIAVIAIVTFFAGALADHLVFVGHRETREYPMRLVLKSPVLLRSRQWPQILFLTGEGANAEAFPQALAEEVPVKVSVVTDYGCIRSAVVTSVGTLAVPSDHGPSWTWRLNKYAATSERNGPGNEDLRFPWCLHFKVLKDLDEGPVAPRFWDEQLRQDTLQDTLQDASS